MVLACKDSKIFDFVRIRYFLHQCMARLHLVWTLGLLHDAEAETERASKRSSWILIFPQIRGVLFLEGLLLSRGRVGRCYLA